MDLCGQDDQSPLVTSCRLKYYDTVRLLLDAGADMMKEKPVHEFSSEMVSPLTEIIDAGDSEALRIFIQYGADLQVSINST